MYSHLNYFTRNKYYIHSIKFCYSQQLKRFPRNRQKAFQKRSPFMLKISFFSRMVDAFKSTFFPCAMVAKTCVLISNFAFSHAVMQQIVVYSPDKIPIYLRILTVIYWNFWQRQQKVSKHFFCSIIAKRNECFPPKWMNACRAFFFTNDWNV